MCIFRSKMKDIDVNAIHTSRIFIANKKCDVIASVKLSIYPSDLVTKFGTRSGDKKLLLFCTEITTIKILRYIVGPICLMRTSETTRKFIPVITEHTDLPNEAVIKINVPCSNMCRLFLFLCFNWLLRQCELFGLARKLLYVISK